MRRSLSTSVISVASVAKSSLDPSLGPRRGAIRPARQRPVVEEIFAGVLGRQLFVEIDPQPRLVVRVHKATAHFGTAREHLVQNIWEDVSLLNAEVRAADIKMQVSRVANRR